MTEKVICVFCGAQEGFPGYGSARKGFRSFHATLVVDKSHAHTIRTACSACFRHYALDGKSALDRGRTVDREAYKYGFSLELDLPDKDSFARAMEFWYNDGASDRAVEVFTMAETGDPLAYNFRERWKTYMTTRKDLDAAIDAWVDYMARYPASEDVNGRQTD